MSVGDYRRPWLWKLEPNHELLQLSANKNKLTLFISFKIMKNFEEIFEAVFTVSAVLLAAIVIIVRLI